MDWHHPAFKQRQFSYWNAPPPSGFQPTAFGLTLPRWSQTRRGLRDRLVLFISKRTAAVWFLTNGVWLPFLCFNFDLYILILCIMKQVYPTEWPQFFTATVYKWQYLLDNDKHKTIITESLRFLVKEKRIVLYAFVVMSNHIHLIWQPFPPFSVKAIQASFMRYTGRQLRAALVASAEHSEDGFKANRCDREYQIWKRDPLSVELFTGDVFTQKLEYIHQNPVKAGLCKSAEDYFFSSAKFYHDGTNDFDMLTHFAGSI